MRGIFVSLFLLISAITFGQRLSDASTISLLTASPGDELYSTFGHSAIRVKDTTRSIDLVFNYGTFNPYVKNFYIKFARRKVDYVLSVAGFEDFTYEYIEENRSVVEQVLNLTDQQKTQLYGALLENYKPENRAYRYDFFFDNCATRIRDLLPRVFGEDFQYNYPEDWQKGDRTFRNLIDLYLTHHHWSDFGIDLALGLPTDAIASPSDYMFLPDYLMEGFAGATITHNGENVPLVISTNEIIPREDVAPDVFFITPIKVGWALFFVTLALTFYGYKQHKAMLWFDMIFLSIIGLVGWAVFSLDFLTDHIATKSNLNMLWAVPIHLPVFLFWRKLSPKVHNIYVWIFLTIDVIIFILWKVFPQNYHIAFIPLILSMIVRFLFMIKLNLYQQKA